jgi:hypothetical protein
VIGDRSRAINLRTFSWLYCFNLRSCDSIPTLFLFFFLTLFSEGICYVFLHLCDLVIIYSEEATFYEWVVRSVLGGGVGASLEDKKTEDQKPAYRTVVSLRKDEMGGEIYSLAMVQRFCWLANRRLPALVGERC